MLNSDAFSYINVLDRAADASWQRESIIANNIANNDTPGFKRSDLEFASVLRKELMSTHARTLNNATKLIDLDDLKGMVYKDYETYSYRLDGNNVDIDTENVELASEQLNYQAMITSISNEFKRLDMVTKK